MIGTPRTHVLALAGLIVMSLVAFDPGGFAPFGPSKWTVVTVGVLLGTAMLFGQQSLRFHRVSTICWGGFLIWGALSAALGIDPIHAWIGTPERHLGLLTWMLFALAFFLGQNSFGEQALLMRAAVLGLAGMGIYTAVELTGAAPVVLGTLSARAGGPFGSPAYLGAACTLLIPIGLGVALDRNHARRWRMAGAVASGLGLLAIVGSQTRGAMVGLLAGLAFLIPTLARRLGARNLIVGLLVLVVAMMTLTPLGERLLDLARPGSVATAGRIDEWRIGLRTFSSNAITGVGPEGYRVAFPSNVDAEYERRYTRQVAPDRAHNGALDTALTLGVPGLIAYLAAAVWILKRAIRAVRSGDVAIAAIAGGVVGYLVQQQFLFPLAEIDPLFWVFVGVLVASTNGDEASTISVHKGSRGCFIAGLSLSGLALVAGSLDIAADRRVSSAYRSIETGLWSEALAAADQAHALRPDSIRYWFVAADIASRRGDLIGIDAALDRIEGAVKVSPDDPILRTTRARLLLERAQLTEEFADLTTANNAYAKLIAADPYNAQNHLLWGVTLVLAGDLAGAEREWLLAEDLAPFSTVPAANLVRLYVATGRLADAK
ncbi:MAG: O-antigen ligase family protein, partial [Acidimicrobiia bacterium]|nr:O-antigen ligase family protein [Acidimicrobiia bacterium]